MCLSIPSKALSIDENNLVIVKALGTKCRVRLNIIGGPVFVGGYILIHVGFVMQK
ncbi:HypC/HybG/HupF family hydrogenase formation chaperone [Helicobacter equorum]|uniref:HypC/HybG/HupF family hydrogenase formation chaperone n=1 Tax=Helicobacter equorum TaxID=361872 RepID=UPI001F1AE90A|nr:HypC/HybG/HupF family hydrogenase formation chaperone [Helicobacter equorum]